MLMQACSRLRPSPGNLLACRRPPAPPPATSRRLSASTAYFTLTPYRVGGLSAAGFTGPLDRGPDKFKFELHHPALRRSGSSAVDMYAVKFARLAPGARVLVIGSAEFGAGEMSTRTWADIHTDSEASISWGTELGVKRGTVVSRNENLETWSVKLDDGDFSEGRLLEHVPASRLSAGMQTRILMNPGTSVGAMVDHVRIMWPEPVEEEGVKIEISGAPVPASDNTVWIRQMAEGKFAVRVNGCQPIPCKSNGVIVPKSHPWSFFGLRWSQ
jgi:hypothetical protein